MASANKTAERDGTLGKVTSGTRDLEPTYKFEIDPKEPCPCDQKGLPANQCCLRSDGSFFCSQQDTRPQGVRTGFSHPGCYARALVDCSKSLSREHYISASVLNQISKDGTIEIGGFPWQKEGVPQRIPVRAFGSKILCSRHNSALSQLDQAANRLGKALLRPQNDPEKYWVTEVLDGLRAGRVPKPFQMGRVFLFSGYDIERWILKMLCGLVFSGAEQASLGWVPHLPWLSILFGEPQVPEPFGMFHLGAPGEKINYMEHVVTQIVSTKPFGPSALGVKLHGYRFFLTMTSPPPLPVEVLAGTTYRPSGYIIDTEHWKSMIHFSWHKQVGKIVVINPKFGTEAPPRYRPNSAITND